MKEYNTRAYLDEVLMFAEAELLNARALLKQNQKYPVRGIVSPVLPITMDGKMVPSGCKVYNSLGATGAPDTVVNEFGRNGVPRSRTEQVVDACTDGDWVDAENPGIPFAFRGYGDETNTSGSQIVPSLYEGTNVPAPGASSRYVISHFCITVSAGNASTDTEVVLGDGTDYALSWAVPATGLCANWHGVIKLKALNAAPRVYIASPPAACQIRFQGMARVI